MWLPSVWAGSLLPLAISVVFTAVGLYAVLTTGELVWPTVFFGACTAILLVQPLLARRAGTPRAAAQETVEFDDTTIRRRIANGPVESITWADLAAIDIVTTDAGPYVEDVFWLLAGRDPARGCAIANEAEGFTLLLARLQALPGFDNGAVIRAMTSTGNARFAVWRRPD